MKRDAGPMDLKTLRGSHAMGPEPATAGISSSMPDRSSPLSARLAGLVELHGPGGRLDEARARGVLTRTIYEMFEPLRPALISGGSGHPLAVAGEAMRSWCELAVGLGVLARRGRGYRAADNGARTYLAGGWLEELMALALLDAECQEVRFSQQIRWRAPGGESDHYNEVDALALYGGQLVIVSCKATATDLLDRSHGEERMFQAMLELSYWNTHFGNRAATPIFVTTTDFYDEEAGEFRSPKLMERARILGLNVLTADFSTAAHLTRRLRDVLRAAA
jgi:hypothetical protein